MTPPLTKRKAAIRFIVFLGIVSLFADMTYEGARSITGPYLKDLGATATQVGIIAGLGEMIAASLRYFSGRLADRTHAYWGLTFLGYGLNLIAVPALAFVGNWQAAALLVAVERTGKSLRGPARDVLLSEATAEVGHGWGFGLHAAMDQTGAVLGPLLMAGIVAREGNFGPAFIALAIPAALTMGALLVARKVHPSKGAPPPPPSNQPLPPVFKPYIIGAGILALGFVDFPILAFHLQNTGVVKPAIIPLMYAGAMAAVGATAFLCGRLFDKYGIQVLAWGILISMLSLPLGFLGGPVVVGIGIACWGVGLGVQDATLRAGIAQVVSMNKRGTAFGAFNGLYGVMWFFGSVAMGVLYERSIWALVVFGVVAQLVAAVVFFRLRKPLAEAGG